MTLSKPAMMSAFLCPGLGQWAAGQRALGAAIILVTVSVVAAPFVHFIATLLFAPPCDPFALGIAGCAVHGLALAWHASWPTLAVCLPVFALIYSASVWHANTLTLPD